MEVKRVEPLEVLRVVLERLERQAIKAGSHPVLIHEGLEALDRLREENVQLKAKLAKVVEAALDLVGEYESHGGEDTHRTCLDGCGCVLPEKVSALKAAAKGE